MTAPFYAGGGPFVDPDYDPTGRNRLGPDRPAQIQIIPNAILPRDPTGQALPGAMNAAAQASTTQQILTAARDGLIPITYGGPDRIAGKLYLARINPANGALVLCLILGEGPIDSVGTVELNDLALSGAGVSYTIYTGTLSQGVDSALAACIPGFTKTMPGTAYAVVTLAKGISTGFPRMTFEVNGLKVYDPRDGTQTLGVPSTYKWSDNPALCLADFLASTTYGARKTVDWTAVTAAANYCDGTVTGTAGTEKRATISLTIDQSQPVRSWIEVLRAYVPAWIDYNGATAVIQTDSPRSSDFAFTAANIDIEVLPALRKRGVKDLPTVVEIGYMRTDIKPWAMAYAEANTGSVTRRKARIDLPGIRRYSQALRFATERLNHYTLEDLEGAIAVFEDGLKVMLGDRATITDNIGLAATEVRITGVEDRGHGRWLLGFRKYDPLAYSSLVEAVPSSPSTGLPDPRFVAAPTALVVHENYYLENPTAVGASGMVYQSRFETSWTGPVHAYPLTYRVRFLDVTTLPNIVVAEGTTLDAAYASHAVQQGRTYTIEVTARNSIGFASSPLTSPPTTALGKGLLPTNVPAILTAFELGGEVLITWAASIDLDAIRYEWKYGPTVSFSYAAATLIDQIDGLRARFKGIPVGTWRFAVKAIDSISQRSATETTVDVTVTSDANAFVNTHTFSTPVLTNVIEMSAIEGGARRWATAVTGDVFNTVETSPVFNAGVLPVLAYHASATQRWQGETWDLGISVTGTWQITANVTVLSGSVSYYVETSAYGSAWTRQSVGLVWVGASPRMVRPVIEALTTSTFMVTGTPSMSIAAATKGETGLVTTSSQYLDGSTRIGALVQLAGKYSAVQDLQVTAVGALRSGAYDRVLVHPQVGLLLQADTTAGAAFVIQNISSAVYVIVAGDYLEYDVWTDVNAPAATTFADGGLTVVFNDATTANALADVNGYLCAQPAISFDAYSRGMWTPRAILLTSLANGTRATATWRLRNDSAGVGPHKTNFRNIRITNGGATVRVTGWSGGEPTVNTTFASAFATNIKCGPSNSFLVFVEDNTNALIPGDARYSYRGF